MKPHFFQKSLLNFEYEQKILLFKCFTKFKDFSTLGFRVAVVVVTIIFAVVIPHFTILMGFIGSFTGCFLSFIWPCIFHLALRRHTMSIMVMAYDIFIIFLGIVFGLLGMYYSGKALHKAFVLGVPV